MCEKMNRTEIKKLSEAERIKYARIELIACEIRIKDKYHVWGKLDVTPLSCTEGCD